MDRPTLHFAQIDEEIDLRRPEGWRMRVTLTGWRRVVADAAMRLLNWLGAVESFWYEARVYRYGPAEQEAVSAMLFKQIDAAMSRRRGYWEPGEWVIVIGGKEFAEIAQGYVGHNVESFPMAQFERGGPYRQSFAGLPVHVVPHLSGAAVLPKAIIEARREAKC